MNAPRLTGYTAAMTDSQRVPAVSVIIPSLDGYRSGCVPRLLETVDRQTFRDHEVRIVKGVAPQGKAINQGVRETRGRILIILDDDSWLADDTVFDQLITTLESDPKIGMAGASIVAPPGASPFQSRAARQFPRFNTPVVEGVTDSDLACHGCCAIPRSVFEKIGGEREDLIRGLDPDLRLRLREAGYRVVLAPNARIHHPLPDGWRSIIRTFFRNGYGSAYAQKFRPDSVIETHESLHEAGFRPKRSFVFRLARFPVRLLKAAMQGRFIRLAAYKAYALGYIWGLLAAKENTLGRAAKPQDRD